MPPPIRPRAPKFTFTSLDHYCERGVHGCGYRSYRVNLSIVIRPSITSDPKTIAKHAGVRKNGASNTAEGVRILLLRVRRHKITNCERGVNGCGYRSYRVKWGIVILHGRNSGEGPQKETVSETIQCFWVAYRNSEKCIS